MYKRQRVKQAAKELDFHPNQMAKSLVSRKTRIVGIVFPGDVSKSLGNPFYPSLLQGLGRAAGERRYHLLLVTGGGEVSAEEASRQAVDSGYVSGLVLLAAEDVPTRDPRKCTLPVSYPFVLILFIVSLNNSICRLVKSISSFRSEERRVGKEC